MRWVYQKQQVTRFVVSIRPDNIPSRRLAEQIGFHRIGSHMDDDPAGRQKNRRVEITIKTG
jgi:RimJ/RimL family protein N-acetyltransferase